MQSSSLRDRLTQRPGFAVVALAASVLLMIFLPGVGEADPVTEAPHPKAPTETAQLDFLIGEWDLTTRFRNADGSIAESTAQLRAWYVLDGFGIQAEDRHPKGAGAPADAPDFISTKILIFDPGAKKWAGSSVNSLGNRKQLDGTFEDGKLVLIQSGKLFQDRPGINRLTYHNISEDGFALQFDHSPDNGKSWQENTYSYTAQRRRP